MYKLRSAVAVVLIAFVATGCAFFAPTPKGKLAQVGSIIVELDDAMYQECVKSKANDWRPLAKETCRKAATGFEAASAAWARARAILVDNPEGDVELKDKVIVVVGFILELAEILARHGLAVPEKAKDFVDNIKGRF